MSPLSEQEMGIRRARLEPGDLDALREALNEGHNLARSDAYALIHEIDVLRARYEEARTTRDQLIRQLGKRAYP